MDKEVVSYRYRFGSAEFDEARAELRVRGLPVELQFKPLQLLSLLLSQPGEVLQKEEIYRQLWGDRVTADNVMANAVLKLRTALGPDNGGRVATVARQGYRLDGPVERVAVGRRLASRLDLVVGAPVPGRDHFVLVELLDQSHQNETWRARQPRSGESRVYKFAVDGKRLAALKREATVYRLLHDSLGERPDIARVLDWNFDTPPCFLECEDGGLSLPRWAEGGALLGMSGAERLDLALQVVDAVAAAHAVGVLHKDLKPQNVLVAPAAPAGAAWQVRLTDFGNAALLDPQRLQALNITALGMTVSADAGSSDLSGTAYYIAPELHTGAGFTVRSDLFSLGVMLYQLLCGDLQRLMAPGWERDLNEPLLVADLARATDLDPARRFSSVAEFAQHLRALPERRQAWQRQIAAQAQAERERQQWAQANARRPWLFASAVLLLGGLLVSLWLYQGQRQARQELAHQLALVQALNAVLTDDMIGAANPALVGRRSVTVVEALSAAASGVDQRFAGAAPDLRAALHLALQRAFSSLARFPESLAQGQKALRALAASGQVHSEAAVEAQLVYVVDLVQLGRLAEARDALADFSAAHPDQGLTPLQRARWLWARASVLSGDLSLKHALPLLTQAQAQLASLPPPLAPAADLLAERVAFDLAQTQMMLGDYASADSGLRHLVLRQETKYGASHQRPLYTRAALGACLGYEQQHDAAKAMLRVAAEGLARALGPQDRKTLSAQDQLAGVHFRLGDYAVAASLWTPTVAGYTALLGASNDTVVTVESNVGLAWLYAGEPARAETWLRQALAHARVNSQDEQPRVQELRFTLADTLLDLGRAADVPALLAGLTPENLNLAQQAPDWPARIGWLQARLLRAQGRREAALQALDQVAAGLDPAGDSQRFNPENLSKLRAQIQR